MRSTSPAASSSVRATTTVTSDSADAASGVASALFQRSPAGTNTWTNIAAADTASPYTASVVDDHGVTDGLYDLRVTTTDNVGNTFTSGAHHQRAGRQHRADGLGDRTRGGGQGQAAPPA